ncbi:MAG: TrmH family RNA methyltransferase [Rubrivivax sp.]
MSLPEPSVITSRSNPLLKRLRQLLTHPAAYRSEGEICIEGEHLCAAYRARGGRPRIAVFAQSAWQHRPLRDLALGAQQVQLVADSLLSQVSALPSAAGVVFVAALPPDAAPDPGGPAVLLDRLQDPGNVGSILRTASALGVRQVWTAPGTAALWSPKVLRAGMGAHFALELCEAVDVSALALAGTVSGRASSHLPALGRPLEDSRAAPAVWVATSSHAGAVLGRVTLPDPCVWVLGHEGQGVAPALLERCRLTVRIPQPGGEESLNVAAAAAICLYESARQRLA